MKRSFNPQGVATHRLKTTALAKFARAVRKTRKLKAPGPKEVFVPMFTKKLCNYV